MSDFESKKSPWNSLEVMKILVAASLPIMVVYFGASIKAGQDRVAIEQAQQSARLQQQQVTLERVAKWRFDRYEQAAGLLNDMYVYFIYVGKWKELTPRDIIERKREVDKIFYSSGPIYSKALISRYDMLIDEMFKHFQGWGEDAMLRTSIAHRKEGAERAGQHWDEAWSGRFTEEENENNITSAYNELTRQLALDLGIPMEQ